MAVTNIKKSPSSHFLPIFMTSLILISCAQPITASSKTPQIYTNFVRKSCSTTTYPSLCIKSLTPYASSIKTNALKLCSTALSVAIKATSNCSSTASKLAKQKGFTRPEALAIKNCIGDMKDAVSELKDTVNAMAHLKDGDREFEWANAKTYASAAITDADTCVDEILERKVNPVVKQKIRSCVSGVEQHISNALALINHLY